MKAWIFSSETQRLGKIAALLLSITFSSVIQATPAPLPAPTASEPVPAAKPVAKTRPVTKASTKSEWYKLTPMQQVALAPLAADWSRLDTFQKEKWLELANRFSTMSAAEQARMQERMRDWVKLSPEQRHLARESYARVKKLDAERKARQWEQYQQLPDEKKKELAATIAPKKQIVNPPRQHVGKNAPKPTAPAQPSVQTAETIHPSTTAPSSSTP